MPAIGRCKDERRHQIVGMVLVATGAEPVAQPFQSSEEWRTVDDGKDRASEPKITTLVKCLQRAPVITQDLMVKVADADTLIEVPEHRFQPKSLLFQGFCSLFDLDI